MGKVWGQPASALHPSRTPTPTPPCTSPPRPACPAPYAGVACVLQPASRLEFVINDGGSDWDKPAGAEGNYVVTAPGTYRLKNGKLTQLA